VKQWLEQLVLADDFRSLRKYFTRARINALIHVLWFLLRSNHVTVGPGLRLKRSPGHLHISLRKSPLISGGSGPHPWKATRADNGATKKVTLHPGTVNGFLPSNILEALTITGTGTEYIQLTGDTNGHSTTSLSLSIETTAPEPNAAAEGVAPSEWRDVIAVLVDGAIFQVRETNLIASVAEAGIVDKVSPTPGTLTYTPWYSWSIA